MRVASTASTTEPASATPAPASSAETRFAWPCRRGIPAAIASTSAASPPSRNVMTSASNMPATPARPGGRARRGRVRSSTPGTRAGSRIRTPPRSTCRAGSSRRGARARCRGRAGSATGATWPRARPRAPARDRSRTTRRARARRRACCGSDPRARGTCGTAARRVRGPGARAGPARRRRAPGRGAGWKPRGGAASGEAWDLRGRGAGRHEQRGSLHASGNIAAIDRDRQAACPQRHGAAPGNLLLTPRRPPLDTRSGSGMPGVRPAPVVALHPPWPHPPSMIARTLLLSLATACALACAAPRSLAAAARDRDAEATRLLQHAERLLAMQTIEQRRSAIADLERATDLAPARPDVQITLARAYYKAGFLKQAKIRYERAVALAPENSQARFGLGQAWERDWLKYLERSSLDLAGEDFAAAGRLDSSTRNSGGAVFFSS